MKAFIINLSNIFDFNISMPILCNLIASKKVWVNAESSAFPVNPSENLIEQKLFEFYNKYEHQRVTLDNSQKIESAELFLIIGYEEWSFLSYGKFNAYPLFKIKYILNKLSQFFNEPVKSLPFKIRIFLTPQKGSERHYFFENIEQEGFAIAETTLWFSTDAINNELNFDINHCRSLIEKEQAHVQINEQIRAEIEKHFESFILSMKKYSEELQLSSEISKEWCDSYKSRLDSIKTMKQFAQAMLSPTPILKTFLNDIFSLVYQARNLPSIYKYAIDTSTTASGLQTKFEYMQFMLQFVISPFLEDKNKMHKIDSISINKTALEPILGKLKGTINHYNRLTVDLEKEVDYNVYTVNDSYYRGLPSISAEDRQQFYNLNPIRHTLGWFYNRDKRESVQRNFERNTYRMLESKIPIETEAFNSLLKGALNKQTKTTTIKMIPSDIQRFDESKLISEIDFHQYAKKRDELLTEQGKKIVELQKLLPTLPFALNVFLTSLVALLLLIIFSIPIFLWLNWDNTLMLSPIYAGIVLLAVTGSFFITRSKIDKKVRELEEIRASLAANLVLHCEKIKTVSKQMAESFAKRETLKELKNIRKIYDDQAYRYLAYNEYHKVNNQSIDSLSRIYDLKIIPSDNSNIQFRYDRHPEDDPNLLQEFPVNILELIINKQEIFCSNIRTIIQKIEIKSY